MLIAIGSDGNVLESQISKRFGHSNYFILYDTNSQTFDVFKNDDNRVHNHENLIDLINNGAEVFIVGNIGPHAFELIKSFNKKIFLARKMTIENAIKSFLNGELTELFEPTVKKSIGHRNH